MNSSIDKAFAIVDDEIVRSVALLDFRKCPLGNLRVGVGALIRL